MRKHFSHRGDFAVESNLWSFINISMSSWRVSSLEHGTIQIRTNFIEKNFLLFCTGDRKESCRAWEKTFSCISYEKQIAERFSPPLRADIIYPWYVSRQRSQWAATTRPSPLRPFWPSQPPSAKPRDKLPSSTVWSNTLVRASLAAVRPQTWKYFRRPAHCLEARI